MNEVSKKLICSFPFTWGSPMFVIAQVNVGVLVTLITLGSVALISLALLLIIYFGSWNPCYRKGYSLQLNDGESVLAVYDSSSLKVTYRVPRDCSSCTLLLEIAIPGLLPFVGIEGKRFIREEVPHTTKLVTRDGGVQYYVVTWCPDNYSDIKIEIVSMRGKLNIDIAEIGVDELA